MTEPLVSIVIPVYNRGALVREAIASVLAERNDVLLEVVVVDDASTDDTWEVVRAQDVRAVRMERNGGQSAARNRGLDESRGTYVKYLDSDDVLMPGHLEREVRALQGLRADIAVSGWISETPQSTREYQPPRFVSIVDDVLAGLAVPTSAALYARRTDWRWDPELRKLDDWDYFVQAALGATRIATVDGAAYRMRDHAGPRATEAGLLVNAREHHRILHKMEERLAGDGLLTPQRSKRLAQYFYKELRVLSLLDRPSFEAGLAHIFRLDPRFAPRDEERQWWMRLAARFLGARQAILLHGFVKKNVKRPLG
jgi:glycosyltransferase involved in cell wall biosynthesis